MQDTEMQVCDCRPQEPLSPAPEEVTLDNTLTLELSRVPFTVMDEHDHDLTNVSNAPGKKSLDKILKKNNSG